LEKAIGVMSCWLHMSTKLDFVEPSNICENDVSSKMTFAQGFDDEPEAMLCVSVTVLN